MNSIEKAREGLKKLRWKDLTPQLVVETLVETTKEYVAPLEARVQELEKALAQREYKGVYSVFNTYQKHNSVTHSGCIWIATEEPTGSPPGHGWVLAVKRGRDQREQAKDNFAGEHSYRREPK